MGQNTERCRNGTFTQIKIPILGMGLLALHRCAMGLINLSPILNLTGHRYCSCFPRML